MRKKTIYSDSAIVRYKNGDITLDRTPIVHRVSTGDKYHTIRQDETLPDIAFKEYNDPLLWFIIADVNRIFNPFDLEVGNKLIIPNKDLYEF